MSTVVSIMSVLTGQSSSAQHSVAQDEVVVIVDVSGVGDVGFMQFPSSLQKYPSWNKIHCFTLKKIYCYRAVLVSTALSLTLLYTVSIFTNISSLGLKF